MGGTGAERDAGGSGGTGLGSRSDIELLDVVGRLPDRASWAVAFRLERIGPLAGPETLAGMFGLPPDLAECAAAVALTSVGPFVVVDGALAPLGSPAGEAAAWDPGSPQPGSPDGEATPEAEAAPVGGEPGLGAALGLLAALPAAGADCIGLGTAPPWPPVAMGVHLGVDGDPGRGRAEAVFAGSSALGPLAPLLAAVGVRPEDVGAGEDASGPDASGDDAARGGGTEAGEAAVPAGYRRARFAYDLRRHLEAARLGRFRRTGNCNRFFLVHASSDAEVEAGLGQATTDRVGAARRRVRDAAVALAEQVGRDGTGALTMRARPASAPLGTGDPYGDLVPAGLLLAGLRILAGPGLDHGQIAAGQTVRAALTAARGSGGWAFHTGTLVTATDSALVLLGLRDAESLEDIERFADGSGGYVPQRSAPAAPGDPAPHPDEGVGAMPVRPATAHWHQADAGTTALVMLLRRHAGLPARTPVAWLAARFDRRASLFFANPWLCDLTFALALGGAWDPDDPDATLVADLQRRLRDELLASANPDGSFGRPDERPLATACAIGVLAHLGIRGRLLTRAQLRLAEALEAPPAGPLPDETSPAGTEPGFAPSGLPVTTPFASTARVLAAGKPLVPGGERFARRFLTGDPTFLGAGGDLYALTLYDDVSGACLAGFALAALGMPGDPGLDDTGLLDGLGPPHPRYRCRSVGRYVADHVLPAYPPPP